MERLYFSKENFKILYGILQKKLITSHKYDIENNETFNKELVNIMKTIYSQKSTFNMPSNISDFDVKNLHVLRLSWTYITNILKLWFIINHFIL